MFPPRALVVAERTLIQCGAAPASDLECLRQQLYIVMLTYCEWNVRIYFLIGELFRI